MSVVAYVFGIVVAVLVLLAIAELLRRRRVRERHAVWWLAAGIVALVIAVFPDVLDVVSSWLGIAVPTNFAFFLAIILLFLVSVSQSAELTVTESKTRLLAESVALLEERLHRLEEAEDRDHPQAQAPTQADPVGVPSREPADQDRSA